MKGEIVESLSKMIPGNIYVYGEFDKVSGRTNLSPSEEESLKDSKGNILYTFVFIEKRMFQGDTEIEYRCDLVEGPEGSSEFKLYETLDQYSIDIGTAVLYKLSEI